MPLHTLSSHHDLFPRASKAAIRAFPQSPLSIRTTISYISFVSIGVIRGSAGPMTNPLNIALIGCGTVGSGVAKLLLEQGQRLADRAGFA